MKRSASIPLLACVLLFGNGAAAQTPTTPPAAKPEAAPRSEARKPAPAARKPAVPEAKPSPLPAATATPAPAPDNPNVDLVYGAFQRGEYKTTRELALPRAQAGDPK